MRNIEDIEKDLTAAREALGAVEGTPAEVYSRIVGYYRSVRNWNRGKREEYGERRLFQTPDPAAATAKAVSVTDTAAAAKAASVTATATMVTGPTKTALAAAGQKLLLFVRPSCPSCPPAKDAAGRLGIPVDLVDAGTEAGLAEAGRRNVFSTPTAILLAGDGSELDRARDSSSIAAWGKRIAV